MNRSVIQSQFSTNATSSQATSSDRATREELTAAATTRARELSGSGKKIGGFRASVPVAADRPYWFETGPGQFTSCSGTTAVWTMFGSGDDELLPIVLSAVSRLALVMTAEPPPNRCMARRSYSTATRV